MKKVNKNEPKLQCWLKLHEVLRQYETSNKEIIKLITLKRLQVTLVDDEPYFYRGNLQIHLTQK